MKIKLGIISALLLLSNYVSSQVNQEWVSRYDGTGNGVDDAYDLTTDVSGNVYVTGRSTGIGTGFDYLTVKYNSAGIEQWTARYFAAGNNIDQGLAIAVDGTGNVYVTGYSYLSSSGYDYATIKYNSAGVEQWVSRYNGPGNNSDFANSIVIDASGNIYVSGSSAGAGSGADVATIKYNSEGVQQWVSRYNGPAGNSDGASSIKLDAAGNVYIAGSSIGSGSDFDYVTIKYNSDGVQQWASRYNGPGNASDNALSLAVDISGNVYITGYSFGTVSNNDYATIKYNSSGAEQWVQRYNGPGNHADVANSLAIDAAGNVFVTGSSAGIGTNIDFATVKYNASGSEQWVSRYNGPGNNEDAANSIALDPMGNIYITGYSIGSGTGSDYATVKYNSSGVQQWVQRYDGPSGGADGANTILPDAAGNVYITGSSPGTNSDFATIKYSQSIGIQNISGEVPDKFILSQNYPNPFNPVTNIIFSVPKAGFVKLIVFDILGNEIEVIVNQELSLGTYRADWNAANYSGGVYFYRLEAEGFVQTRKMILIK